MQARRFGRRFRKQRGGRSPRPWWKTAELELATLERGLPAEYAHFKRAVIGRALVYRGEVELDPVPVRRRLTVIFPGRPSTTAPIVMADGPQTRRHRFHTYRPTSLCLWYAGDHPGMRWQLQDGLVGLIDTARVHLVQLRVRRWATSRPSRRDCLSPSAGRRSTGADVVLVAENYRAGMRRSTDEGSGLPVDDVRTATRGFSTSASA